MGPQGVCQIWHKTMIAAEAATLTCPLWERRQATLQEAASSLAAFAKSGFDAVLLALGRLSRQRFFQQIRGKIAERTSLFGALLLQCTKDGVGNGDGQELGGATAGIFQAVSCAICINQGGMQILWLFILRKMACIDSL